MKLTKTSPRVLSAIVAVVLAMTARASAQVVINEIHYDDSGTDDYEFVELFNAGASAVDISGWTLGGRDNAAGFNPSALVPAATSIAAGGYYVFGNAAVAGANQIVAANFLENDAEQVQLWSGVIDALDTTLVDGLVTEANKGAGAAATQYGTPSANMAAQIGGGYRGNFQSGHINGQGAQAGGTGPVLVSLSRFSDGLDSNVNGRDFGYRRATPGAANSSGTGTLYNGPNVDSLSVGTEAPGLYASFVNPRVINPTVVSTHNPTAISASPQGGNAVTIWDTEFGGTGAGLDTIMQGGLGTLSLLVYVDPRLTAPADSEEWIIGMGGGADALHNLAIVAGTVNGSTGLGWVFRRDGTTRTLRLIDFGPGGASGSWVTLGTIPLTDADLGWHVLGIDVNGTTVSGNFDATIFGGTTSAGLTGNLLYASYREVFANNADPLLRPLTIDLIPEPSVYALGLLGVAAFGCWRRRK